MSVAPRAQIERGLAAAAYPGAAQGVRASIRRFIRLEPVGFVFLLFLLLLIATVIVGPWIWPHDPLEFSFEEKFVEPGFGTSHWLGTDQLGRDVAARVLAGGRLSLGSAFSAITIGIGLGSLVGLVSGYIGGWRAQTLERAVDGMMAVPPLILAMALAASLGNSRFNIILAIAVVMVPTSARVVRSATLSVRNMDFVTAATAMGASGPRILLRHIFPNVVGTVITTASIWIGAAIIIEASLGFVGIGTQPPAPSWGGMLSGEGRSFMISSPHLAIVPGVAISLTVLAFNMLGDSLRSYLDPKSRGRL